MNKDNLIERFRFELSKVNGECLVFNNIGDGIQEMKNIITRENIKKIVINDASSITKSIFEELKNLENINIKAISDIIKKNAELKNELKDADLGISCANYLIAETGSVVISCTKQEPRSLSLLPDFNIIISTPDKIFEKLEDVLNEFGKEKCVTIITGPSRTADIEKVLVTGVHGPRKLVVFIFRNS